MKKKEKSKKVMYLSEVDEKIMEKDILRASKLVEGFKDNYKKFMGKLLDYKKVNTQTRMFCVEMLLMSLIHDGNLPNYVALGMLDKIKNQLLNENFKIYPEEQIKKIPSYAG